jgi:hypothetical protein
MVFKIIFFFSDSRIIFLVLFKGYITICKQSTAAEPKKEPEKVEVFVDGKAIHVEPNTTVLQVKKNTQLNRNNL